MNKDKPKIKINPPFERASEFSETRSISSEKFFEDIAINHCSYLQIRVPGLSLITLELDEREVDIGRSPKSWVQLQMSNVSRLHARIIYRNEEYQIEDLDSTNGTFVNGIRVQQCVLRNSDQIQIGNAEILFIEERRLNEK